MSKKKKRRKKRKRMEGRPPNYLHGSWDCDFTKGEATSYMGTLVEKTDKHAYVKKHFSCTHKHKDAEDARRCGNRMVKVLRQMGAKARADCRAALAMAGKKVTALVRPEK